MMCPHDDAAAALCDCAPLRALSLLQPWAWLVTAGPKDVENRTWHLPKSMLGKRFLVHASAKRSRAEYDRAVEIVRAIDADEERTVLPAFEDLAYGGIVGSARATECLCPPGAKAGPDDPAWERSPWWFSDQHGFVLEGRTPLPFAPCKGALGFWAVPADVTAALFGGSPGV